MNNIVNTKLIIDYIENNKLTKKEFCKLCDISKSTLNRIIIGNDFFINSLYRISKVMGVKFYQLFN